MVIVGTEAAQGAPKRQRPPKAPGGQLLDVNDLARYLKVSRTTIYRLLDQGLPHLRVGYHLRFDQPEVLRWLRAYTEAGHKLHWSDDQPGRPPRRAVVGDVGPARTWPGSSRPWPRGLTPDEVTARRRQRRVNPEVPGAADHVD